MRNLVDHPIDKKTQSDSKKITFQEIEFLHKQIKVALQEIFDSWLSLELPENDTEASDIPEISVETTDETIESTVTATS